MDSSWSLHVHTCVCVLRGRAVQSAGEDARGAQAGGGPGGPVHLVRGGGHPPPPVAVAPEFYQQPTI